MVKTIFTIAMLGALVSAQNEVEESVESTWYSYECTTLSNTVINDTSPNLLLADTELSKFDLYKMHRQEQEEAEEQDSVRDGKNKDKNDSFEGGNGNGRRLRKAESEEEENLEGWWNDYYDWYYHKFYTCNPELYGGWKTYYELSEVTLFHEDCQAADTTKCLAGAVFEWVGSSSHDRYKCAVGRVRENNTTPNYQTLDVTSGDSVTGIDYATDANGQFSYFKVSTQNGNTTIGALGASQSATTFTPTGNLIGLFVDAPDYIIKDFGAFYQDNATCDCTAQTSIVWNDLWENMYAIDRDSRQRVHAITDVGPRYVWDYCGKPSFVFTTPPAWFTVDDNKITASNVPDLETITTIDGTMSVGPIDESISINVYMNTYVNCDELGDGTTDATAFIAWVASEKGVTSGYNLYWRTLRRWTYEWWNSETDYLSKYRYVRYECTVYDDAWDAVIAAWQAPPS